jgi:hypothetical protein
VRIDIWFDRIQLARGPCDDPVVLERAAERFGAE